MDSVNYLFSAAIIIRQSLSLCLLKLSKSLKMDVPPNFTTFIFILRRTKPNDWNYIVVNKSKFFRKSSKEKIKGTLPLVRIALILHSLEENIIMDRIRRSEEALNSGNLFGFIVDVVKARRLRNTTQKIQTVNCKY